MVNDDLQCISIRDAEVLLQRSRKSIENDLKCGRIKSFKLGSSVKIPLSEIERLVNGGATHEE